MAFGARWPAALLSIGVAVIGCGSGAVGTNGGGDGGSDVSFPDFVEKAIGPSGGRLNLGDARIVIPDGALGSIVTIRMTRTNDPAPAGYVSYSSVYKFEPEGLVFAKAPTVTLPFTGAAPDAALIWSQIGMAGYDRIEGTRAGFTLSAPVTHFSKGCVGTEKPGYRDAATEGGDARAAGDDSRSPEGGDAPDAARDEPSSLDGGDTTDDAPERDAPTSPDAGRDADDDADSPLDVSIDAGGAGPDATGGTAWGAPCGLFEESTNNALQVAFAQHGPLLAGTGFRNVKVWRTDLMKEIRTLPFLFSNPGQVFAVGWSPSGDKLAIGGPDGTFVWDTSTWTSGPDLGTHIGSLQYSPDGTMLALGQREPTPGTPSSVTIVGQAAGTWGVESDWVNRVRFSPDSTLLATSGAFAQLVHLWRVSDRALLWTATPVGALNDFQFTSDGSSVVMGTASQVKRVRVSDGAEIGTIAQPATAVSLDGSLFANQAGVWRGSDGSFAGTHGLAGTPVAFSPGNTMLASFNAKQIRIGCAGLVPTAGDAGTDAPPAPGGAGPDLARPANGENTGGAHRAAALVPLFAWRPLAGATSYELEVDDSCPVKGYRTCAFPSPEIQETSLTATSFQPSAALAVSMTPPVGRRYFWRVRALTAMGFTDWSIVRYVNVGRANNDLDGDGFADAFVQKKIYLGSATMSGTSNATLSEPVLQIVGDVNGDGFADWTSASGTYFGSSPLDMTVDLSITGRVAGDLNADGYADLIGSDPTYDNGSQIPGDDGRVWIYYGGPVVDGYPDRFFTDAHGDSQFGHNVAGPGDVNGDGFDDLLVGTGRMSGGGVYLYLGADVLQNTPSYSFTGGPDTTAAFAAGDVDRDGYADFLVVPRAYVTAFQLYGGGTTTPAPYDIAIASTLVLNVFTHGDVNGDGFSDFLGVWDNNGRLHLGQANAAGISGVPFGTASTPVVVGDLNGDGFDDVQDGTSIHFGSAPVDTNPDLVLQ